MPAMLMSFLRRVVLTQRKLLKGIFAEKNSKGAPGSAISPLYISRHSPMYISWIVAIEGVPVRFAASEHGKSDMCPFASTISYFPADNFLNRLNQKDMQLK